VDDKLRACKHQLAKQRERLMKYPGVLQLGIGRRRRGGELTDELCIIVSVKEKLPSSGLSPQAVIPRELEEGITTDVQQIRYLEPLTVSNRTLAITPAALTSRQRPCPGGYSVGHRLITAGTFGILVRRGTAPGFYICSNNHVLANSNEAAIGDWVLQPGPYDGGQDGDRIGSLSAYVQINFPGQGKDKKKTAAIFWTAAKWVPNQISKLTGCPNRLVVQAEGIIQQPAPNLVDAAIALAASESFVDPRIGPPLLVVEGIRDLALGDRVKKWGRTTSFTEGYVDQVSVVSNVDYGKGVAVFEDQIAIRADSGEFSAGGDSGSAILTTDNYWGGLLFAGGEGVTIANRVSHVLSFLGIRLPTE